MMELATIIGSKAATAIRVNNLFVPASSIGNHLRAYTDPALFVSKDYEPYNMTKSGSLTRVKFSTRHFAIITHHQLSAPDYKYDQLAIHNPNTKKLITSHQVIFQTDRNTNEADYDCLIFEFTESVEGGALPKSGWYDLTNEIDAKLPKPNIVFGLGYPGYRNNIDYDNDVYPMAPNLVHGKESRPRIRSRLSFIPDPKIDFSPDGMSGGPVFGCQIKNYTPEIFFAGIITNASKKQFNFLSRSKLGSMFDLLD